MNTAGAFGGKGGVDIDRVRHSGSTPASGEIELTDRQQPRADEELETSCWCRWGELTAVPGDRRGIFLDLSGSKRSQWCLRE